MSDEERPIAEGEAGGVRWRLFTLPTSMGAFLCFDADGAQPAHSCSGSFETRLENGGPEEIEVLGVPTIAEGQPAFVYGAIGPDVTEVRVVVESGDSVRAEIVGHERAHYVALLPSGASPSDVVAYSSGGDELARRGFLGGDKPESEIWEQWQECGKTDDGRYHCEGGASGSSSASVSRECRQTDDGEYVCEDAGRE